MNNLEIFDYAGQNVHTINDQGEPKFLLNDVCQALNVSPRVVRQRLEEDVCATYPLKTTGGVQQATFVNEDGLYDVILDSRKAEAKQFRKWITSEVLPSIRKTGSYQQPMSVEQMIIAQAESVSEVKEKVFVLENKVENQITIDHGEQRMLQKNVARKVYEYAVDEEERRQLFRQAYRDIKDRFAVSSYKDVKRKDLQKAVSYIQNWVPKQIA